MVYYVAGLRVDVCARCGKGDISLRKGEEGKALLHVWKEEGLRRCEKEREKQATLPPFPGTSRLSALSSREETQHYQLLLSLFGQPGRRPAVLTTFLVFSIH